MASQPLRRTINRTLEDGSVVAVERRGSAGYSWWQAADGRRFEETSCKTLRPIDTTAPAIRRAMNASTEDGLGAYGKSGMGVIKSLGSPAIPVVLIAFSDMDFLKEDDAAKIDRFLNEEGYKDEQFAVGSVADYFLINSGGQFHPRFEVLTKVTLSKGYKYYGAHLDSDNDARCNEAIKEAVSLAEAQGVDFSKYATDGYAPLISFIHAGPGEQEDYGDDYGDFFWAHFTPSPIQAKTAIFSSYLISNETLRDFDEAGNVTQEKLTGIGTFCHEFSHALGIPDTYDVNHDKGGEANTPGYWDVMDYQFMYDGYRPMEYNAYERSMLGWTKVVDLNHENACGRFNLQPLSTQNPDGNVAYRIVNPRNPNEYYILENRQKNAFYQEALLGSGLLVWHIDYDSSAWVGNYVNISADHPRLKVVPADGQWQSKRDINKRDENDRRYTYTGDVFPGYANVTTFDNSLDNFYTGSFDDSVFDISVNDKVVSFYYGDPTSIILHTAENGDESAYLYDLQGRKVSRTASTGIYIQNNKKIIRK